MPRDAYLDQARKKCLVVAIEGDAFAGYCLFRTTQSKMRIGITQVCVASNFRRKGVAQILLNAIRDRYKLVFGGMLVSCREDHSDACNLWLKYGFIKKKRVRSRSFEENYLLKFWYSFGGEDLFSQSSSSNLRAAIDLNIIIKLMDKKPEDGEVLQLLADWLTDEVDYYYAKESLNEIHRDDNHDRANQTLAFLSEFKEINCDLSDCKEYLTVLQRLHPGSSQNHVSDRQQIAESKVSKITYFITTDGELLDKRDAIFEELGITILRPAEFILEIDELRNRKLYEPLRLQGANFDVQRLDSEMLPSAVEVFLKHGKGEKKSEFQNTIVRLSSDAINTYIKVILTPTSEKVGLYSVR